MHKKNIIQKYRFFLVLGFFSLLSCSGLQGGGIGAYGGLGQPSDPVPFMEKARTGLLPSGLRYFILENSLPENRAYLTLAVKAGSVHEADDEQGLAHFVEHMAFSGTARFPEAELVNYLRSLGMRFGPEVNAYTSFDKTVYGIEVPVETGEGGVRRIPDTALAVLDDWTRAIGFAPADVDKERAVILEEYRSRLGAMDRIRRKMLPVLFEGSKYAERLPIGKPEIIETAPAGRLEGFYRKWYQADTMSLILVGDFDGAALEASLKDHFSIEKPAAPTVQPQHDLPPPKKQAVVQVLSDPELTATRVDIYFKRSRQAVRGDLSYYRGELIDALIGRMLDFRFEDEAMKSDCPYVYAGAGNARYGASSRFYLMVARAKTGTAESCVEELLREKESLLRYGFTQAEFSLAANSLVSDMQKLVSEKDKQESSGFVDSLTEFYLNGGNHADLEWELDAIQGLLPHIGMADIKAVLKDYFKSGDIKVFISAPDAERESLPSEARVRQMLHESSKMKIAPPESGMVEEGFLPYPPAPGQIVLESVDGETGAVRWELSNGARVILKETKNKNNEIVLQAMARGGNTSASAEDRVSAKLASEMISLSGLGPYPRTELIKKLADKQVSFSLWTSTYNRGIEGSSTNEDLKTLFEMIYLGFTDPRIDPEAVKVMLDQHRTRLAQRNESPDTVFSDEISRSIYGGHPFFKPLETGDLPHANIDSALSFFRRGLNPADYTFIFTGNIKLETLRNYAETYLASIPQTESWNNWTRLQFERPGKAEKTVYKGKEDRSLVYLCWFSKTPYSEEASAAAQVLSEYLDIRMTEEIREKRGGVYSISVGASVSPVPEGELSISVYFVCDPRRVQELSQAVIDLLRETQNTVNQDTFSKSVAALKKQWEMSIQSNSYIAQSYANSSVLLGLPLSRLNKRPQYYDALTPADVRKLCTQALQNGPCQVVLYPEKMD
jgi:zinc protease